MTRFRLSAAMPRKPLAVTPPKSPKSPKAPKSKGADVWAATFEAWLPLLALVAPLSLFLSALARATGAPLCFPLPGASVEAFCGCSIRGAPRTRCDR